MKFTKCFQAIMNTLWKFSFINKCKCKISPLDSFFLLLKGFHYSSFRISNFNHFCRYFLRFFPAWSSFSEMCIIIPWHILYWHEDHPARWQTVKRVFCTLWRASKYHGGNQQWQVVAKSVFLQELIINLKNFRQWFRR